MLARPYPQAVAGTPTGYSFEPGTKRFQLAYTRRRAAGDGRFRRGRTLVFLPRVQYPRGYRVRVRGGSAAARGQRLVIRAKRGGRRVKVTVRPRRGKKR